MRYPEFLKPGDKLGFIAPSFGCTTEPYISCFGAALSRFRSMGYGIVLGTNCYADDGIGKSSTPEKCGAEINSFFADGVDGDVRAIISCGGGETMCEDLPFVDFDAIRSAVPRWFMGYSDNTNLTFTLPVLCDIAAVYGPNAPAFGASVLHDSLADALALLRGDKLSFESYPSWERESLKSPENPFAPYNLTEANAIRTVRACGVDGPVNFSGRLIGGCLDCLVNLAGTPWDRTAEFAVNYTSDGVVWFFESCDLTTMGVRRALWQLKHNGWFRNVAGFIVGRPWRFDDRFDSDGPQEAVLSVLGGYGVPIILDADLGHLPPAMPFISGACAEVSAEAGHMSIRYHLS
ncbi:MAG: LD-carboxypeptidase [Clostridia bacterium]|nr:LD-carboxypeptidase [Clostridia bacterium]